jgi:hypothetical protein
MNAVDQTTAGAASGEFAIGGAEGFIISGKRTDDKIKVCFLSMHHFAMFARGWTMSNLFIFYLLNKYNMIEERERWKEKQL